MCAGNLTRILLVHGALADGSSWSKIIPFLQEAGHRVSAVQQPLMGIPGDVSVVKTALNDLNRNSSDPIVVVGHSFGGLVITNAVTDVPNINGMVYVQAFAPDAGETVGNLSAEFPLPSANAFSPDLDGRVVLSHPDFLKYFAPDLSKPEASVYAAVQGPFSPTAFEFVTGKPAWRQIKNLYYIVGGKDQIISPELETFFAQRMGAKTTVIPDASHIGLVSHAKEISEVILAAARTKQQ
jgi:pimeloyl-ACP methyl ester carboxylesterase